MAELAHIKNFVLTAILPSWYNSIVVVALCKAGFRTSSYQRRFDVRWALG